MNLKLSKFFLLFFIFYAFGEAKIVAQTIEDEFDLCFQSVKDGYRWSWVNESINTSYSMDSTQTINDNFLLKITSSNHRQRESHGKSSNTRFSEDKIAFILGKTIILPTYKDGEICTVSLNCRSELDSLQFKVVTLDKKENDLYADSIYIQKSDTWSYHPISFPMSNAKALRVIISYSGDLYQNRKKKTGIDKVQIRIGDMNINLQPTSAITENRNKTLNDKALIPLSFTDITSLQKIKNWKNKKIIALGESTHGSQDIKDACHQFIRHLISTEQCTAVLLESPMDICLRWDLYVQGFLSETYEDEIKEELKYFFTDSKSTVELLKWVRNYNKTHKNVVHVFGIDRIIGGNIYFEDYFVKLLPKTDAKFYLQTLAKSQYTEVIEHIEQDSILKTYLTNKDIKYLQYALNELTESLITLPGDYYNQRDFNMSKRTDKIVQLYLEKAEKAVIYAHTIHTNRLSNFNQNALKFSLGRYLSDEYREQYYSIAFQAGEGSYTQDSTSIFGKTMTDKLKLPPAHNLEQAFLKTHSDYFFYPANKLPDGILSLRVIPRESRNKNHFNFCYLPKRFDAFVFIKQSHELTCVERYPAFSDGYAGKLMGRLNSLLKEFEE